MSHVIIIFIQSIHVVIKINTGCFLQFEVALEMVPPAIASDTDIHEAACIESTPPQQEGEPTLPEPTVPTVSAVVSTC